jgi:hypothetical protein
LEEKTMTFRMTLDRCQRTLTTLVLLLVPLAAATMLAATHQPRSALATAAATLVALGLAAAYAPTSVELAGRELRITRRLAPPVRLSASEIVRVEQGPPGCDLRLFGVAGFLGSFGLFWSLGFGRYWLYATRRAPSLAVRRRRGLPLVLVVDDPSGLRRAMTEWHALA